MMFRQPIDCEDCGKLHKSLMSLQLCCREVECSHCERAGITSLMKREPSGYLCCDHVTCMEVAEAKEQRTRARTATVVTDNGHPEQTQLVSDVTTPAVRELADRTRGAA